MAVIVVAVCCAALIAIINMVLLHNGYTLANVAMAFFDRKFWGDSPSGDADDKKPELESALDSAYLYERSRTGVAQLVKDDDNSGRDSFGKRAAIVTVAALLIIIVWYVLSSTSVLETCGEFVGELFSDVEDVISVEDVSNFSGGNSQEEISKLIVGIESAAAAEKEKEDDIVYWVSGGTVWHTSQSCRTLERSNKIYQGTAEQSGKARGCKVCG